MVADSRTSQTSTRLLLEASGLPISLQAAGPLCTGLAIIYLLLIPLHLARFDGRTQLSIVSTDALLAAVFLTQRLFMLRGNPNRKQATLLAAANVALPYLSVLLLFNLDPDPLDSGFVAIILIGCGAFLLSTTWLYVSLAAITMSWLAVVSATIPTADRLQLGAILVAASGLAAAVFVSRRRNLDRLRFALTQAGRELAQRESTERKLRESDRRLELAIRGSRSGWWYVDLDPRGEGKIPDNFYLSEALKKLIGFSADELPSSLAAWRERVLEEDRGKLEECTQLHLAGALPSFRVDYRIRHKSGEVLWLETFGRVDRDDRGRPIRFSGMDRDITRRVEQERSLWLLSRAVEQSSSIVLITDPAGAIKYVNPKFTEVTGYTSEEVLGRNPSLLKSGVISRDVYADLWKTIKSGESWHGELQNQTKAGEPFWVLASISPLTDEAGRVVNYLGVQEDVTARKLAEDRLVKSQRLEAVGRLVSGVAHDFNNLLTSILGFSEMALADLEPENHAARSELEQVVSAGESAAVLTSQLLAVGRQQIMEPRVIDLNNELTANEPLLRRTLGEDIEIFLCLDQGIDKVRMDPTQLQRVVLNLAINARDAMPQGGQLSFETANVDLDGEYVESHPGALPGAFVMLAVSDTGRGMDRTTLQRIFEPFFSTKKLDHGTGMGLATTYGIIKQSGGYIWAYSEPDKGSSFKIYLPRLVDVEEEPISPAPFLRRGGSETILLVEDSEKVRTLLTRSLRRDGYTVLECGDSRQALRLAEQHRESIDLVITDLVLPTVNGLELAKQLSAQRSSLKVLLISGYAESALRRKRALSPELPLLTKPFTMADLAITVRRILDGEQPDKPRAEEKVS